jgi:hypothetical protein
VSAKLSLEEILARLERKMAFHREREAYHAGQESYHQEQEVFHRDQRAFHAAELATIAQHYEAFKASAGPAAEIAGRNDGALPEPPPQEPPADEAAPQGIEARRSRMIVRWVQGLPAGEVFGPSRAAEEINRRFGRYLAKPADLRVASSALRRLLAQGVLRIAQRGTAHHESLYEKV